MCRDVQSGRDCGLDELPGMEDPPAVVWPDCGAVAVEAGCAH